MTYTLDLIRSKMRACLSGELDLWEFLEELDDIHEEIHGHAIVEQTAPHTWQVIGYDEPVFKLMSDLVMMHTEMVCSGSYRKEAMTLEDFASILEGKPPTAFWALEPPATGQKEEKG